MADPAVPSELTLTTKASLEVPTFPTSLTANKAYLVGEGGLVFGVTPAHSSATSSRDTLLDALTQTSTTNLAAAAPSNWEYSYPSATVPFYTKTTPTCVQTDAAPFTNPYASCELSQTNNIDDAGLHWPPLIVDWANESWFTPLSSALVVYASLITIGFFLARLKGCFDWRLNVRALRHVPASFQTD